MISLDATHDAARGSWVESANSADTAFPLQNLPLGVFRTHGGSPRIGVAIGDAVLDLVAALDAGLLADAAEFEQVLRQPTLNALMANGRRASGTLRRAVFGLLEAGSPTRARASEALRQAGDVRMELPAAIGDFTDFFTSIHHATRASEIMRPGTPPLFPNFHHLPVAYHGRASSVVVSGTSCVRPWGQSAPTDPKVSLPSFAPAAKLDFELEVGFFVGPGNEIGHSIAPDQTEDQMFGLCLVNDWSARDIQRWENQPLGPFLAKSFLTTVSPWVVTLEALAPFRVAAPPRDVPLLPHLRSERIASAGAFDIELQATLSSASMRERGLPAHVLARPGFRNQYWTLFQMLAHHASNGCNLRPGDLIASGTVSDSKPSESGCMLELTRDGRQAMVIGEGEERTYLLDADEIEFTGRCRREGFRAIGFGSCRGRVQEAAPEAAMVPGH